MPTLTIQLPGLSPVEHILREEAITVGRMKGNSISLDDASVSLSHAKITRNANDYLLKDLNSTNGTMLNGQSISEAWLRDGDQLKFGEVLALFRSETSPATAPALSNTVPVQPAARSVTALPASRAPSAVPFSKPTGTTVYRSPLPPPAPTSEIPAPNAPVSTIRRRRKNPFLVIAPVLGAIAALTTIGIVGWTIIYKENNVIPPTVPAAAPPPTRTSTSASHPAKTGTQPILSANPVATPSVPVRNAPTPAGNQTLADLVQGLQSPDVAARRRAAEAINSFEASAKDALPALRRTLTDVDSDVRMWSALALINNQAYEKAAIPILVQTLHHENPALRQVACISLALIPYEEAERAMVIPALQQTATGDDSTEVRKDAQTALKIIAPNSTTSH